MHSSKYTLVALFLIAIVGCSKGPKTYPVHGSVELADGDITVLNGSYIEAALVGDPKVRASGQIAEDGSFKLQTRHEGVILNGAVQGTYQVRIILADDDVKLRRQAAKAVAPRFLDLQKSGVSIEVPASGDVTVPLASR